MTPKISIVVPFFDEEESVEPVLRELRGSLDALGECYEVLLVDDGSTDRTGEILNACSAPWPQCKILNIPVNRGQAAALLFGFSEAKGAILMTLDGDGQNDPADLLGLLKRLESEDLDMVVGIRAQRQDSNLRRAMSYIANAVRQRALGDGMRDSGCALKVFRREVLRAFIPIRTLYSFMPALAKSAGFRVAQMAVNHRSRCAGRSKYGFRAMAWYPLIDMLGVAWFARRRIDGRRD